MSQVETRYPRLSLEVVLSILATRDPQMVISEDGIDVTLDAAHIALLLDAASSEEGSSGVEAPWADEACWRVYEVLKEIGSSWMEACVETAEAAIYLDKIANEGLDGSVRFAKTVERLCES